MNAVFGKSAPFSLGPAADRPDSSNPHHNRHVRNHPHNRNRHVRNRLHSRSRRVRNRHPRVPQDAPPQKNLKMHGKRFRTICTIISAVSPE